MSPEALVQAQFDAYNAQDLDRFMTAYAEDAVLASFNGAVLVEGAKAIRERHANLFGTHPQNKARLVSRIAFGDFVIDHEDVERTPGGERFHVAAIYTIKNGLIARVDFLK